MNWMLVLTSIVGGWRHAGREVELAGGGRGRAEKTLRELMAERGLDENGRKLASVPLPSQPVVAVAAMFTIEFSYDSPGGVVAHARVGVTTLDAHAFHGFLDEESGVRVFAWGRVRGLVRLVDTEEMVEPREVIARYC
ncbi:hypothetical protein NGA35_10460 [Pseudomonas stutzeri]|nr:hypothetical protein [Stutzerimonas stutzeri]